ncbi:MAG: hypothetical protein SWK76_00555 [Actinomycetota bacterium]|nr:hypothetical protein [Actinomycetota bacterium]
MTRKKTGKEMRPLLVAVSLTKLLLLAIIAYFMMNAILTTNNNIKHNKQLVIDQSVSSLTGMGDNISSMTGSIGIIELFNQDIMDSVLSGDWDVFYTFTGRLGISFYPVDYIRVIRDGDVIFYKTDKDYSIDASEMPT